MLPWHLRDLLGPMVLCCSGLQCGSSSSSQVRGREVVGMHQEAAPGIYPLSQNSSVRTGLLALVLPCLLGRMGRKGLSFITKWGWYTGMLTAEMSMVWLQPADSPTQMLLVPSQAAEKHFYLCDGLWPSLAVGWVCGKTHFSLFYWLLPMLLLAIFSGANLPHPYTCFSLTGLGCYGN